MFVCTHLCVLAEHTYRSEDKLQEAIPSLCCVGPRIELGHRNLYWLSHLNGQKATLK